MHTICSEKVFNYLDPGQWVWLHLQMWPKKFRLTSITRGLLQQHVVTSPHRLPSVSDFDFDFFGRFQDRKAALERGRKDQGYCIKYCAQNVHRVHPYRPSSLPTTMRFTSTAIMDDHVRPRRRPSPRYNCRLIRYFDMLIMLPFH